MNLDILAIAAAVVIVLVPGGVLGYAVGLRRLHLIGLAGPLGIALTSAIAVLDPFVRLPLTWWQPFALAGVAFGISALLRRPREAPVMRRNLPVILACAIAGVSAGWVAFGGTPLGSVNSTYDGVFHLSAVAHILATGDGSSFTLYRISHPGTDLEFYPAAWHDLVALVAQLTGASVPLSTNASWIAAVIAVWAPGIAYLADMAFGRGEGRGIPILAALLAVVFPSAPYLLLNWGTLFPTGLAYALVPAGLALALQLFRRADPARPLPLGLLIPAIALWGIGALFSHPRSLFSLAVLALPLALGWVVGVGREIWRRSNRRAALLAAVGAAGILAAGAGVAVWTYLYRTYNLAERPISDHLNGGPATAHQSIAESLWQALLNAPVVAPSEANVAPAILLSVLTVGALAWAVTRREARWAVAAWLLIVVLYCLAAGSNSDLAKLATGLWYKDKYRLISLLPVITAPLLAAWLVQTAGLVRARARLKGRGDRLILIAGAALLLASATTSPTLLQMQSAVASSYRVPDGPKDGALVNADELALLERLPDLTPPGAVVIGDPWNGSVLAWAVGEREPLFPHLVGDWGADRLLVAQHLAEAQADPAVCAAIGRLGADYLFVSPGLLWNGDPQAYLYDGIRRASPSALGELVAKVGDSALYRLTVCG